jgi:hypothetical protein
LSGRFGVFHLGRLILEASDGKSRVLTTEVLVPTATPLSPVVVDLKLGLPTPARTVALVLQDPEGRRIGEVARYTLSKKPRQ